MLKFEWMCQTATYLVDEGKPVLVLFGKGRDGKKIILFDECRPYVWIKKGELTIELIQGLGDGQISILNIEEQKKEIDGKHIDVYRVELGQPSMVPQLRQKCDDLNIIYFEADILFVRRYFMDKNIHPFSWYSVDASETEIQGYKGFKIQSIEKIEGVASQLRVIALDIETLYEEGKTIAGQPILMIALYADDCQKVFTWNKSITHKYAIVLKDEKEMLVAFVKFINEYKPEVITGYFSDGFDFPVLMERCVLHKLKLSLGVDGSEPRKGRGMNSEISITGIDHVDMHAVATGMLRTSLSTDVYTLDAVASELLGESKVKEDVKQIGAVWNSSDGERLNRFVDYNLQDSKLCFELVKSVSAQIIEMCMIVGLPLQDVTRMPSSQLVEWFLMRNAAERKIIIPNKPGHEELKQRKLVRFQGGAVFEPKPGLYEPLLVFDFMSLYPTIIASHNIGNDTFRCECCKNLKNRVPLEGKDYWFCAKKKGFISQMIQQVFEARIHVKSLIKKEKDEIVKKQLNARQLGLKLVANSMYGYLGFGAARWYSFPSAESTTAYGRHYINSVIKLMKEAGYTVVYSDTDSIFVTTDPKNVAGVYDVVKKINDSLPGIMELDFEGEYLRGLFVGIKEKLTGAKKKYALISKDGTLKVRGFTSVRRNSSYLAKDLQQQVLRIILEKKDAEGSLAYVRDVISKVRSHSIDVQQMVIRTQLSKPLEEYTVAGPHVKVAQRMRDAGIPVSPHTIIPYVIVAGGKKVGDRARFFADVGQQDYDAEYYVEHQIIPSVESILAVFGYGVGDIQLSHRQKKLDSFFG